MSADKPETRRLYHCGEPGCPSGACGHAHCTSCNSCVSVESGHKFKDHASWREWQITRLCQACQDVVFTEADDDPIQEGDLDD